MKIKRRKVVSQTTENNKDINSNENKFRLNLGPVNIKNLTLDFEDKNLPIPFKTTVSKLNGEISEIKNKEQSVSQLEIKGEVDQYGSGKNNWFGKSK